MDILMLSLSFVIPIKLLYFWDKLGDEDWWGTFDALTKANRYLKNDTSTN
jgi:hypothetical protein